MLWSSAAHTRQSENNQPARCLIHGCYRKTCSYNRFIKEDVTLDNAASRSSQIDCNYNTSADEHATLSQLLVRNFFDFYHHNKITFKKKPPHFNIIKPYTFYIWYLIFSIDYAEMNKSAPVITCTISGLNAACITGKFFMLEIRKNAK